MTDTITTDLNPVPSRKSPSTFSSRMDDWLNKISTWTDEANALATGANTNKLAAEAAQGAAETAKTHAETAETNAKTAQTLAQAAANYKGAWSDLTGEASVGISVSHSSIFWALNVSLADITASEPSAANTDWSEIAIDLFASPTAREQSHAIALYF